MSCPRGNDNHLVIVEEDLFFVQLDEGLPGFNSNELRCSGMNFGWNELSRI
jgi:hypothetical protein